MYLGDISPSSLASPVGGLLSSITGIPGIGTVLSLVSGLLAGKPPGDWDYVGFDNHFHYITQAGGSVSASNSEAGGAVAQAVEEVVSHVESQGQQFTFPYNVTFAVGSNGPSQVMWSINNKAADQVQLPGTEGNAQASFTALMNWAAPYLKPIPGFVAAPGTVMQVSPPGMPSASYSAQQSGGYETPPPVGSYGAVNPSTIMQVQPPVPAPAPMPAPVNIAPAPSLPATTPATSPAAPAAQPLQAGFSLAAFVPYTPYIIGGVVGLFALSMVMQSGGRRRGR